MAVTLQSNGFVPIPGFEGGMLNPPTDDVVCEDAPKDIRAIWIQTYFVERHENSHTVFAERTGLPRAEAKLRAYTEAYSTPIVRAIALSGLDVS